MERMSTRRQRNQKFRKDKDLLKLFKFIARLIVHKRHKAIVYADTVTDWAALAAAVSSDAALGPSRPKARTTGSLSSVAYPHQVVAQARAIAPRSATQVASTGGLGAMRIAHDRPPTAGTSARRKAAIKRAGGA